MSLQEINKELTEQLELSNAKLVLQDEVLEGLKNPPLAYANVVGFNKDNKSIVICKDGDFLEVHSVGIFDLKVGMPVTINQKMMITGTVKEDYPKGSIGIVERVDADYVKVTMEGRQLLVLAGSHKVSEGDSVVVGNYVVKKNLGKTTVNTEDAITEVSWDEIGGLVDAKEEIREVIEMPMKHKELFAKYNKSFSKGVLLYGPPGNGKTMLGKAAATSLAKMHGKSVSTGFIYVKGPELLNPYVGATEANIRALFNKAKHHFKTHKYPAVIFIDEADSILRTRGSGRSSDIDVTTVATFLAETDGLTQSSTILFLTTNRPETIDPAVMRDGRIDKKIKISQPCIDGAEAIINVHLRNRPIGEKKTKETLAKQTTQEVFAHSENGLTGAISGAFLAELMEQSAICAIKREIAGCNRSGIVLDDVKRAIDYKIHQIEQMKEG